MIPIAADITKLDFHGAGYPLVFEFFKFLIYMLIIIILCSGFFNIISNSLLGEDCKLIGANDAVKPGVCALNNITRYALPNKMTNAGLNHMQEIMNLFTVICMIILFQGGRKVNF